MRVARLFGLGGWTLLALLHTTPLAGQITGAALRAPASGHLADGTPIYSAPLGSSVDVLRDMAARSAVIFVGMVAAVRRPGDDTIRTASGSSVVEVDFSVERGVLGVASGATYAMREWAGLWRDAPRFAVGQRLLMLLHAPGPGGLSSPVDGLDGAIPVRGGGASAGVALGSVHAQAQPNQAPAADDTLDMRWLQAKTLRNIASAGEPAAVPLQATPKDAVDNSPADALTHILGLLDASQRTPSASN